MSSDAFLNKFTLGCYEQKMTHARFSNKHLRNISWCVANVMYANLKTNISRLFWAQKYSLDWSFILWLVQVFIWTCGLNTNESIILLSFTVTINERLHLWMKYCLKIINGTKIITHNPLNYAMKYKNEKTYDNMEFNME